MLTVSGYDTLSHKLYSSAADSGSVSMEPRAVLCLNDLEETIAVCSENNFPHLVFGRRSDLAGSSLEQLDCTPVPLLP